MVKPFISDKVKLNHIASNTGNSISVPFTMLKITSGDDMSCITFAGVGSFTSNMVPGEYFFITVDIRPYSFTTVLEDIGFPLQRLESDFLLHSSFMARCIISLSILLIGMFITVLNAFSLMVL